MIEFSCNWIEKQSFNERQECLQREASYVTASRVLGSKLQNCSSELNDLLTSIFGLYKYDFVKF